MENTQSGKKEVDNKINDEENKKKNNINIPSQKNKIQISKSKDDSPKKNEIKKEENKKEDNDGFVMPIKTIKRSNSIKLYKKHKKDKEKKSSFKKDDIDIKDKTSDIFNVSINVGTNRNDKSSKNVKQKRVVFLPNFLTIIDVESYKKFNEENTCKDPFDNMELINEQLNIKKNDDEADGKTRVLCNCLIC